MALKKIICLILMVALSVFCIASCNTTPDTPDTEKTITDIELVAGSVKTTVNVGEKLDTSNLKIKVTYSDGSTAQVASNQLTIGRIDTGVAGVKKLSVTYEGFTKNFDITVNAAAAPVEPVVTSITNLSGFPTALSIGDTFSAAALTAKVTYSDGTSKTLGLADGLILGGDTVNTAKGGTYYITVSYKGVIATPVAVTVSATITGIEFDEASFNTVFYQNDTVNLAAIRVYAVYNDSSRVRIANSDLVINTDAITTDTIGGRSFTISYTVSSETFTDTVTYSVVKKVVRIEIDESTVVNTVLLKESIDTSSIVVSVVYSDETSEPLSYSALQFSNVNTSVAGEKTLTVRYGEFTDSVTITVEPKLSGIAYRGDKLQFIQFVEGSSKNPEIASERFAQYVVDGVIVIELIYDKGNDNYAREQKTITSLDEIDYLDLDVSNTTDEAYIHIYYNGFDANIEYSVIRYLDSIVISENSSFVSSIGHNDDELEALSGIAMTAVYSNGETEEISKDDLLIENFSTKTVVAEAQMTISYANAYGAASTTVSYEIYKKFASLVFADTDYITVYKPGQAISDATTVAAMVIYSDGTFDTVTATLDAFTFDTSTIEGAQKEITFFYVDAGETTRTGSVVIEVLKVAGYEISGLDTYVPYWNSNEEIEAGYVDALIKAADVSVTVIFENASGEQTTETLAAIDVLLSHDIDIKTPDTYAISVATANYGIATTEITVGPELAAIELVSSTTVYFQNGTLSLGTIVIKAIYHDGTEKEFAYNQIADALTADGFDSSEIGTDKVYTLTYTENGASASVEATYSVYEKYDEETTDFRFIVTSQTIAIGDAFDIHQYGRFVVNGADVTEDADFVLDCKYDADEPLAGIYTITASYRGLTSQMQLKVVIEIENGSGDNVTDKTA